MIACRCYLHRLLQTGRPPHGAFTIANTFSLPLTWPGIFCALPVEDFRSGWDLETVA